MGAPNWRLSHIWRSRLPEGPGRLQLGLFLTGAALLVVLVPSQLLNDVPFWKLSERGTLQGLLCAAAFFAIAAILSPRGQSGRAARLVGALPLGVAVYGLCYLFLRYPRNLVFAEGDFIVAAAIGISAAVFLPYLIAYVRALTAIALVAAIAILGFLGTRETVAGLPRTAVSATAVQSLSITSYPSLLPPTTRARGGGVERYKDGFLAANDDGDFYALTWSGASLKARKLSFTLPSSESTDQDRDYLRARKLQDRRVTDFLLDETSSPPVIYVSTEDWHPAGQCFTVRVIRTTLLDAPELTIGGWTPLFESQPCLRYDEGLGYLESGGRMQRLGDRLLLTVGDFEQSPTKQPPIAQAIGPSYGKVWSIDPTGRAELFSLGHRNPQGLFVDSDGRVWETEHGPQGGDELNLLEPGRNYGYPLVTYGADYGRLVWSLAPSQHDHGEFQEPVFAFAPWVGLSNLIRIERDAFPAWRRDLLLASLNAESLYRIRLRDQRAIYVEQIPVRQRIRDLVEGADGRIVVWADSNTLLTLSPGPTRTEGVVVFGRCRTCHSDESGPSGVSLRGIVGRKVANVSDYDYSPALRQLGGTWTEQRLDEFLADPERFASGSGMVPGRVTDPEERKALIAFLRGYK
jgi:aldose sugar dehydrogenase